MANTTLCIGNPLSLGNLLGYLCFIYNVNGFAQEKLFLSAPVILNTSWKSQPGKGNARGLPVVGEPAPRPHR